MVLNLEGSGAAALVEGETLLVEVRFPTPARAVEGSLPFVITPASAGGRPLVEPQPLFFYRGRDGKTFRTILSVPLDSGGRQGPLRLTAMAGGARRQWTFEYESILGQYGRSRLALSRQTTAPSPEVAERRHREFEANAALYRRRTRRQWVETFSEPVAHASRKNFGLRRTIHGTLHYRHSGLDYPTPIGTPVRAINAGRVAFSGEQWTPGRVVILDHGGGIFSRYLHLSERTVEEGDLVERGQLIGRSGNSGGQRPAPHLHLDVFVNGTPVNPRSLMRTAARLFEAGAGVVLD